MTLVRWTEEAFRDLEGIRDHIQRDSPVYARMIATRLYESVDQLRMFPDSGSVVPERDDPTIRQLVRRPYRIIYSRLADAVEILTIFHSAQLFPAELLTKSE